MSRFVLFYYDLYIFAVLLYVQSLVYKNEDVSSSRTQVVIVGNWNSNYRSFWGRVGRHRQSLGLPYSLLSLDGLCENKSARIYSKRSMLLSIFRRLCFCGNFQGFQVHLFRMRKIKSAQKISKSWCTQARAQLHHLSIQIKDSGLLNVDIQNAKQQYWSADEGGCAIFFLKIYSFPFNNKLYAKLKAVEGLNTIVSLDEKDDLRVLVAMFLEVRTRTTFVPSPLHAVGPVSDYRDYLGLQIVYPKDLTICDIIPG